jgi:hypothetical protein
MDWLIAQKIVIGRGPDGDESGWMQLLVFVVLAVFWAIGGIMKARSAKSRDEKQKQQAKPRPQPRARPSFERIMFKEPERPRPRPMQTPATKITSRPAEVKAVAQPTKQPKQVEAAGFGYREILPKVVEEEKPIIEAATPVAETAALSVVEGPEVEIGTSEQLRAAMLHFEIFGKCVGLRESQEHVWMR